MAPAFGLVLMLGLAGFFYKAAEFELLSRPLLWGATSCLLYLIAVYHLDWSLWGALFLQLLLFLWMGGWITLHRRHPGLTFKKLRASYHLRQGRCPRCAYDLRATPDHCPECGWTNPDADSASV